LVAAKKPRRLQPQLRHQKVPRLLNQPRPLSNPVSLKFDFRAGGFFRRLYHLEPTMKWICLALVIVGACGCGGSPPDRFKSSQTERPRKGDDKAAKAN
jgi:hypothetical protein